MAANCPNIGKSNVQRVFVEIENTSGVLQKPTATGFILPAGQATISQTPEFTASTELSESLNIKEQFQNAVGAGEASIPLLLRIPDNGGAVQGEAILKALMGETQARQTATVTLGSASASATEIPYTAKSGVWPHRGVLSVGSEKILYKGMTANSFTHCVRGYGGTTAATVSGTGKLASKVFSQSICRPTVSVWVQSDHVVMHGSGGVVTQLEVSMSNEGGQQLSATVQFRRLGWAGRSYVSAVSGAVVTVETSDNASAAEGYTVGAYIKNTTKADTKSGAGYRITSVDIDNGTITLDSAPASTWEAGDQIDAWLPDAEPIGDAVESRQARVNIDGVVGTMRSGTLTIQTPTEFINEVGDEYPGENADTQRTITITNDINMRAKDVVEIGKGYRGYEVPFSVVLGKVSFVMPRVKLATPTVGADGAFVTLSRTGAVLGTKGEDALYIVQE